MIYNTNEYKQYLKDYRKKLRYSKRFVCRETGISYNTLTNVEQDRTKDVSLNVLSKLANLYELELYQVFSCGDAVVMQ